MNLSEKKISDIIKQWLCVLILSSLGSSALCHPIWILPSAFNVSDSEGEWVTFDVSASHTLFNFDKSVALDELQIYSPDGDRNYLGQYYKSQRRSVFDYHILQSGTYRFSVSRPPYFFTSYKSGKRDTPKRMLANKLEAQQRLPKNAREVKTTTIDMEASVYVTSNEPTERVLVPKGKGFELIPKTHPNDIVIGEKVIFLVLMDGEAEEGVEIEMTAGGTQYRDDRNIQFFQTDKQGLVSYIPNRPGPWYLSAVKTVALGSNEADEAMMIRFLTFEVLPE